MPPPIVALDIKSDVDRMVKQMGADIKQVKPALNATINRMVTTIRKEGVKKLSKLTGLKQKKLRESIVLIKSNINTLRAVIKARGKPFNLASFSAKVKRVKGRNVGVNAKPWNRKRFFKGGFILNVPGSPVFKRTSGGIKPMFGPGVTRESLQAPIIALYNKTALRRFREEFPRQLKHRMSKGKR